MTRPQPARSCCLRDANETGSWAGHAGGDRAADETTLAAVYVSRGIDGADREPAGEGRRRPADRREYVHVDGARTGQLIELYHAYPFACHIVRIGCICSSASGHSSLLCM